MQAVVVNGTGAPDVLQLVSDHPKPTKGPKQVLIRVVSSSVNPVDVQIRSGVILKRWDMTVKYPKVLGGDLAGYVEEADEGSRFKKGDAVAALTPGFFVFTQDGTYCQYVVADEDWVAKVPEGVDVNTAGGVPLVGLTAWQSLQNANPKPGQRVLVMAASGGVGHMAVQLAKALGLYVVGVVGPANVDWVKQHLGADEVVDYSKQDFSQVYANDPFDIIIDCLPDNIPKCVSVLKATGHISHIQNLGSDKDAIQAMAQRHKQGQSQQSASHTLVAPNGAQLEEVLGLMAAGKVKLEVAKVYPLSEVSEAHRQVETQHTRGKVVLRVE